MKQTNMMKLIGMVGVTTATAFIGAGEANAIPVALDTFDVSHDVNGVNSTDTISGASSDFIGGSREIHITDGDTDSATTAGSASSNNPGQLVFNTSSGTRNELVLRYDSNSDNNPENTDQDGISPAVDLTGSSDQNTGLLFENVVGNGKIIVDLFSSNGQSQDEFNFLDFSGTADFFRDFSDFTTVSGSGVGLADLDNITAAQFTLIESTGNTNLRVDAVNSTPDPEAVPFEAETSAGLALLGTWGAWKYWKRRKQQQVDFDNSEA